MQDTGSYIFLQELFSNFEEIHYFMVGLAIGSLIGYLIHVIRFKIVVWKNGESEKWRKK